MPWLKVDDKFHDHRKVLRTLRSSGGIDAAPIGLWTLAAAWCADNSTDGFVPDYMIDRWSEKATEHAGRLVAAGLWCVATSDDGDDGYVFHDWADYQPLKASADTERAYQRRKTELHRDHKLVHEIRERDDGRCRYCGSAVDFSDRRSNSGGTYDHVDPDGPNNISNVVVACRGCNSAKGNQTPDEWGYALLKPGSMGPARRRLRAVPDTDLPVSSTTQDPEGGRAGAGRAGSGAGSGRAGSGVDPDSDQDLDTSSSASSTRRDSR